MREDVERIYLDPIDVEKYRYEYNSCIELLTKINSYLEVSHPEQSHNVILMKDILVENSASYNEYLNFKTTLGNLICMEQRVIPFEEVERQNLTAFLWKVFDLMSHITDDLIEFNNFAESMSMFKRRDFIDVIREQQKVKQLIENYDIILDGVCNILGVIDTI